MQYNIMVVGDKKKLDKKASMNELWKKHANTVVRQGMVFDEDMKNPGYSAKYFKVDIQERHIEYLLTAIASLQTEDFINGVHILKEE